MDVIILRQNAKNSQLTDIFILNAPGLSGTFVSNNIELVNLQVVTLGDNFYDIDVSNNINLVNLSLGNNKLEFLNTDNNVELKSLLLDGNTIGNIDISKNTKLETLFCRGCTLLTAVDLNNGVESTVLGSVLLTGNPELTCIKVGSVDNAETQTGWEKDDTANFVEDLGPRPDDPLSTSSSEGAFVDATFDLDELFGVESESSISSKSLVVKKKRRRWRRNRRSVSKDNYNVVDFPNTGAGLFYYDFEYIVLNECGKEYFYEVEVIIQDGYAKTEDASISLCNNTEVSIDLLSSIVNDKAFSGDWYARQNGGDWVDSSDSNFGQSDFYKYASDHESEGGGEFPEDVGSSGRRGSTVTVDFVPCSVKYSFANATKTNDGSKDFYEVDVFIESSADFKMGSGQLYFNYNTEALGENIASKNKIEISQPSESILGETHAYPVYKDFKGNDDSSSRVSISFIQSKSSSILTTNNVTLVPKPLLHLKIEYTDASKSANFVFETDDTTLHKTYTACGPYSVFGLANCIDQPGVLITDFTIENSQGVLLGIEDETVLTNEVRIFPNPVSKNLTIDSGSKISKIEIYSLLGTKVKDIKSSEFNSISISSLSSGMYLIKIFTEKSSVVKRIIKE